jgi:Arc/MetJ family transcription regulator
MSNGQGCNCNAHYEGECSCTGVDWRSAREVELEAENITLDANLTACEVRCIDLSKELHKVNAIITELYCTGLWFPPYLRLRMEEVIDGMKVRREFVEEEL